ncbi:GGDEF domain-containing protein [Acidicapsa dinghuensis]|uniref:diguanylate cyclase n=1 Tax=Acidicapsa dinghuensis TaxID=2218256 RepID=A0ABW1E9B1_9BACT|nr:GGDEF domain-containing protein [Acidicapsa dinghuensis]
MSLLTWFDPRTLYGCQCMLAVMFAILFLWMGRAFPSVRGVKSMALAFVLGIPCTFFLMGRGHIPDWLSVIVANLLAATCFLLVYDGILRFVGGRRQLGLLCAISAAALCVVVYFSEIKHDIVPRIVAMGIATATIRAFTAWELLRIAGWKWPGRNDLRARSSASGNESRKVIPMPHVNRSAMRFFGGFLAMLSALGVSRVVLTMIHGAPQDFMQRDSVQISTMLMNVAYIGVYGLCFLTMAGQELILRSQEESEKDALSGVLNRRGIEARLSTELKRCSRSMMKLSIALVDIDHFKRLNDAHGHAAGDAAIRQVAAAIGFSLRDADYLGRYGGDEFLVILPMTACHQAEIATARFRRAVGTLQLGSYPGLTLSVGLTEASPEDDAISLIARADSALYRAKSDGRNCTRSAVPSSTYPVIPITQPVRVQAQS